MSTPSAKANVIDADAHVVETEALDPKTQPQRSLPVIVSGAYSRSAAATEEGT
jgi:hypothetical protein